MRTDRDRVEDILDRCQAVAGLVARGREAFDGDSALGDAIQFNLLIIGEAVAGLTPEFRARHPVVPWTLMVGMRNRLIHAYFGTSLDTVWTSASEDVPRLTIEAVKILANLPEEPS